MHSRRKRPQEKPNLIEPVKQAIIKESTIQDAKADFRDELAELSTEDPNQAGIDATDQDWLDES